MILQLPSQVSRSGQRKLPIMADCPRCKLSLRAEEYEGAKVLFCSVCWGHWVKPEELAKILFSDEYEFSKSEVETVKAKMDQGSLGQEAWQEGEIRETVDAACPECGQLMKAGPFADDCPVEVDRCAQHGIWLDTAEVKQLQIYFESKR